MENKIYLVSYNNRFNEDVNIFVTKNKYKAQRYCRKFNNILKKWKKEYSVYDRWNMLNKTSKCKYEEVNER